MGLFDYVSVAGPEFRCSEGHDLSGEEFQTKDLGCTMGYASIGKRISISDGGWGETQPSPFTGAIEIYTDCKRCPVFVQDETFNMHTVCVEFAVVVVADKVERVTMTSKSSAEQIAEAPTLEFMPGCRGPMNYEDAHRRHVFDRKFFPWDPVPAVNDETREKQRQWRERIDAMRAKYNRAPRERKE